MVANNNSVSREENKNKRVYGQLEFYPSKALSITIGGDYASYSDTRTNGVSLNGFAGYRFERVRVGVEGFYNSIDLDGSSLSNDMSGLSIFAALTASDAWEIVSRFDYVNRDNAGTVENESFVLVGFAYSPDKKVQVIPNVLWSKKDIDKTSLVTSRLTLFVKF